MALNVRSILYYTFEVKNTKSSLLFFLLGLLSPMAGRVFQFFTTYFIDFGHLSPNLYYITQTKQNWTNKNNYNILQFGQQLLQFKCHLACWLNHRQQLLQNILIFP